MNEHIVNTTTGKIRGYERNDMVEYLGIPFAEAPVGALRLKRAIKKKAWDGVLDAKEYGEMSFQLDGGQFKGSDDCLSVNVQRPLTGEHLPVFVWIHGGGYNTGSACDELYNGKSFVREGIVFFSFQYRLNVLGFYDFSTYPGCEDFDSNCGLSDQILALQWIHDNVEAFGGDPEKITIAGESAGAASVINLMAAPTAKGLFTQAIVESGLPNCVMTHETARENIDLFLEGMEWTERDLPKLRTISPSELQKGNTYVAEKHQYKNPGMFLPGPVQDDLLPVRPVDAIRNGSAAGVKLLIGTNRHEGTMFVHPEKTGFPNSWNMIEDMLEKNGHADMVSKMAEFYPPSAEDTYTRFATDYAFEMPSVKVAMGQLGYTEDVWMYRYEMVTKSGISSGMKASHAFELPAVFDNRDFSFSRFVFDGEPEDIVKRLFAELHGAWISFIVEGNPGQETWPRFTGAVSPVRIFDRETRTELLDRSALMNLWDDLRFYEN